MALSDADFAQREENNRHFDRMESAKRTRDVERSRIQAIREQTAELRLLREAVERLMLAATPKPVVEEES